MSWFSTQKYRKELVKDLREAIEKGVAPWQKPWSEVVNEWPRNAITGHHYSNNNAFRLYLRKNKMGYKDPRWLTYNQARDIGAHVKLGEKGTYIMCYVENGVKLVYDAENQPVYDRNGERVWRCVWIVKKYVLFNAQQVEGLKPYVPNSERYAPVERCEKAERILRESGAEIRHGGDSAFYVPSEDYIQLPVIKDFKTSADYYATALHELSHWTGHESRLNRDFSGNCFFNVEPYAFEELVAEISSMFVSAETGIDQTKEHFDNHAAYVSSWLKAIDKDPNALFNAVKLANQAANEILKHERERERQLDGIIEQKAG